MSRTIINLGDSVLINKRLRGIVVYKRKIPGGTSLYEVKKYPEDTRARGDLFYRRELTKIYYL